MRIRSLILSLLLCIATASAKDVIVKTDGAQIDAKVEEVTESVIKYRKFSNLTGPIYSIPISSVASIKYENGAEDLFSELIDISSSPSLSDEKLMKYARNQTIDNTVGNMTDAELLKLYGGDDFSQKKIRKYRKIGWIGGGSIFMTGTIAALILWGSWSFDACDFPTCGAIMGASLAAGAIWCAGFNMKANSLQKQARMMSGYSVPVMEKSFKIGDYNSLTAGINIMGKHYAHDHCLGLSFGINF